MALSAVDGYESSEEGALNRARLHGRIESSVRGQNGYETELILPGADAYDRPQRVMVRSDRVLGQKGEEVTVETKIGTGFVRRFQYVDRSTGAQEQGIDPKVWFQVL